ncbi:MAG: hypothetical protein JWO98_2575 [Frankiales bacterium]|nr:hypothetical protein [Frankiales bacterium]
MKYGQVFRMGMYHANHPDGRYEMANPEWERRGPRPVVLGGRPASPFGDLSRQGAVTAHERELPPRQPVARQQLSGMGRRGKRRRQPPSL